MAGALAMETVADNQKSAFKARSSKQFCTTGFHRWTDARTIWVEPVLGRQLGGGLVFYGSEVGLAGQPCRTGLHRADHVGVDEATGVATERTVR